MPPPYVLATGPDFLPLVVSKPPSDVPVPSPAGGGGGGSAPPTTGQIWPR